MSKQFRVTGLNTVLANLDLLNERTANKVEKGLRAAGEFVKKEAVKRTPIETGALVASAKGGKGATVHKTATGMWTEVSFGNAQVEYAAAVHEAPGVLKGKPRPSGNGNYWDTSGEPKFLQNAVYQNVGRIISIIKSKVRF